MKAILNLEVWLHLFKNAVQELFQSFLPVAQLGCDVLIQSYKLFQRNEYDYFPYCLFVIENYFKILWRSKMDYVTSAKLIPSSYLNNYLTSIVLICSWLRTEVLMMVKEL